jgi:ATP phosphoribosyltransferase
MKASLTRITENPTGSNLSDDKWCAVETVVRVDEIKRIIPLLKRAGATGIVEYPVNKVIP